MWYASVKGSAKGRVRTFAIFAIDISAAASSLAVALHLRIGEVRAWNVIETTPWLIPVFAAIAFSVFYTFGLHRRLWRYASVPDMLAIVQAVTVAIAASVLLMTVLGHAVWMPRSIPIIQWFVLIVMLGSTRMLRRWIGEYLNGSVHPPKPEMDAGKPRLALLAGPSDRVEQLLRLLEHDRDAGFRAVGILQEVAGHDEMWVRGVPIVGSSCDLAQIVERLEAKGGRPECLVFAGGIERLRGAAMVRIVAEAQSLNLEVAYSGGISGYSPGKDAALELRYVDVADLLSRPQAQLDLAVVEQAIIGRSVLVTGAGGTIGRELVRQIAGFKPAKLLLLDANEYNLYEVDLDIRENYPNLASIPVLCSIRQRRQLMQVFEEHRPQLVFHAAALKHVPLVEAHHSAGIQTNVLGTRNVADAARRFGALAMVQVSTDKAVNPIGFMGITKRLGELYCQALDLAGNGKAGAPRFMTVRFGNVLGSSGSLIPLFQRQLSKGGPLTVTHPEIERFFMTVHEAVQLILQGAAKGLRDGIGRGRILVLDMGEPVRVMDIAHRMIRLAGLEPDIDVGIEVVGLRPGEKLFEELFDSDEKRLPSTLPGIFEAEPRPIPLAVLTRAFNALEIASAESDDETCRAIATRLLAAKPDFEPDVELETEPGIMILADRARPIRLAPVSAQAGI
jgi:O-antigen biosynthesis protein WbqV